jgi:DNA processing protein
MQEGVIDIKSNEYPLLLKKTENPPEKLYYRGNWDENFFDNCLAVVGSRRMTSYGKMATEKIVKEIASSGVTIVSGFMYGIDAVSHRAALDAGGKTIAVMPCGVNVVHPEYQKELYDDILQNQGLIISEFEKDFPPDKWTYPKRNRIVAGISKGTFVAEAALKSGSLITAGFAKKYGRKTFSLPGPITSKVSEGTNELIKKGALIVTCAQDILDFYGIKKSYLNKINFRKVDGLEKDILEALKREPAEVDDLSRTFGVPSSEIGVTLSLMSVKGLVFQEGRKYFVKM